MGCPRCTLRRTASNSFLPSARFTRETQFLGRGVGHGGQQLAGLVVSLGVATDANCVPVSDPSRALPRKPDQPRLGGSLQSRISPTADKADRRPPLLGARWLGGCDWYLWHPPEGLRARAATALGRMQAGTEKLAVIEASYASAIIGVLNPVSSH